MKITELKIQMPKMPETVAVAEDTDKTLDSIVERYPNELQSVMMGNSFLYDHDKFYDELYEYFVTGAGRGEMPYGVAKARDGDPDQWITEYLEQEYGREFGHGDPESMDGDFDSAMASAGHGTDEDYGHYGENAEPTVDRSSGYGEEGLRRRDETRKRIKARKEMMSKYDPSKIDKSISDQKAQAKKVNEEYSETAGNQMRKYADIISESSKKKEKVTATRMPMQAPFKLVEEKPKMGNIGKGHKIWSGDKPGQPGYWADKDSADAARASGVKKGNMNRFKQIWDGSKWIKNESIEIDEGHTGPTRMEVQKYFSKQEGLLRAKINATEKAFNIHDLKIDSKGQVVSFEQ